MIAEMTIDEKLNFVKSALDQLHLTVAQMEQEVTSLEGQEMFYASEWWKDGKYLYLVFPSDRDGKRERRYIGCDPEKVSEARASITRWHYHKELDDKLQNKKLQLRAREYDLGFLVQRLTSMLGDKI